LVSVVKAIPRLTDEPSPESTVLGVWDPKMLHGQASEDSGVAELEAADANPVPTALVADTSKVYVVPLVSPLSVVEVAGGDPLTVTGVPAVEPTNGVTA
jgi:hypothetical protein